MISTFDGLYADSKKDKIFNHLMEIIESEENIKLAYRTIKTNTGSDTAGVDKRTINDLAKLSEEEYVRLMKIMSVLITVILYGRMIEIYLYCSVSPIPFATMTNREWGQIGNNYLKSLFAIGFQGFLIMICVGIYAVLVNNMIIADNLHSAIFSAH